MSRYCPDFDTAPMLAAAQRWRQRGLLEGGSLFGPEPLWTERHIAELRHRLDETPGDDPDDFLADLEHRLATADPAIKRLAAEALWLLQLAPNNLSPRRKRHLIETVWSWSDAPWPADSPELAPDALKGVASAGPGFNRHRYRELAFLLTATRALQAKPPLQKQQESIWDHAAWLQSQPDADRCQFRHMWLYLLFPDHFERIFGEHDRRAIVRAFAGDEASQGDLATLDRTLYDIRQTLEREYASADIDFYLQPIKGRWKPEPAETAASALTVQHVHLALADLEAGRTEAESVRPGAYELIHDGCRYSPRQVVTLAAAYAEAASPASLSAIPLLRQLGFDCVRQNLLPELVTQFLRQAVQDDYPKPDNPIRDYRDLRLKYDSFAGKHGKIAALAFLGPNQGHVNGLYPVLLYYRGEPDLLLLAYHVGAADTAAMHWANLWQAPTVRDCLARHDGRAAGRYGNAPVSALFELPDGLDFARLAQALDRMIDLYKRSFADLRQDERRETMVAEAELAYSLDDACDDLFIDRAEFAGLLTRLRRKKNLVLQGPPGVGKTFFARRLAYALLGGKAKDRVAMVQFHPSYAYEDFVQGYRPSDDGGFQLKAGPFVEFCRRAQLDPGRDYVFIIDEINRAHLGKVMGELLLLIEADKRDADWAIPLSYDRPGERFHVPPNLYLIGLMNTADRSIAMVDYALRRRFNFVELKPGFATPAFREHLERLGATAGLIERIVVRLTQLNAEIAADRANLGPGFCIGHSFFADFPAGGDGEDWYRDVIAADILPLLNEYWFDDPDRVERWERRLLEP